MLTLDGDDKDRSSARPEQEGADDWHRNCLRSNDSCGMLPKVLIGGATALADWPVSLHIQAGRFSLVVDLWVAFITFYGWKWVEPFWGRLRLIP
jgi:hypothetical protein